MAVFLQHVFPHHHFCGTLLYWWRDCTSMHSCQGDWPLWAWALGRVTSGCPQAPPSTLCTPGTTVVPWRWLGGCFLVSALPPPETVRINSVNFKNILQRESPDFPKGNLTFTAQYQRRKNVTDSISSY
ncbi:hypothetical protein MC885_004033 [Smutsia gigantea]|nr:hypothetical protein MC885_004033 [Smutsia gigantea]